VPALSDTIEEAARLMTVCNACRYCEGLCAVFPAMELRRDFGEAELDYLANLCHGCGACYVDCQFAPPHEFNVNVPLQFARVRAESYRRYAWPRALQPLFDRNGLAVALVATAGVAAFIVGFVVRHDPAALFDTDGDFYRLMPHAAMLALFGAVFLYAVLALAMGVLNFWRATAGGDPRPVAGALLPAGHDAATLRYLDGGGPGCYVAEETPKDRRKLFHHLTFYGFLLCFAATCAGTVYHYAFGWPAPYPWYQLPQVLGTVGGVGLVVGPIGLIGERLKRDPALVDAPSRGMDMAFLVMILLTGATGLLLMLLRLTPAMGLLLAVHLGTVFALFLTLPYGKFVHGLYRTAALVRYRAETRSIKQSESDDAI
jgi:citrate/tricarballylate utilization protein